MAKTNAIKKERGSLPGGRAFFVPAAGHTHQEKDYDYRNSEHEKYHQTFRFLIQNGADINARLTDGTTVLMLAVSEGIVEFVRILIAAGVEVTAVDRYGNTALKKAMTFAAIGRKANYEKILEILVTAQMALEVNTNR